MADTTTTDPRRPPKTPSVSIAAIPTDLPSNLTNLESPSMNVETTMSFTAPILPAEGIIGEVSETKPVLSNVESLAGEIAEELVLNAETTIEIESDVLLPKLETLAAPSTIISSKSVSKTVILERSIALNPLDSSAWLALIQEVESRGDLVRTREVYERFLQVFPSASEQWIGYANLELQHSHFDLVEVIFNRCLRSSPSIPLWKFYLDYIRRVNPIEGVGEQARQLIGQSFEFALAYVGQDRTAGEIWVEYINFLKQGEKSGTWEDQQRMDLLRKTFQRAVCVPLNNVEAIWQDYNAFENGISKMTAKKFLSDLSPSYMTARKTLREIRALYDALITPTLPTLPDWSSSQSRADLELWKSYLLWEQGNPLDIEDELSLQTRVAFAFRKATGAMRFFSEIWYLSSAYDISLGKLEESAATLKAGMEANPSSLLLAYTLAEYHESIADLPTCYTIYDGLISRFQSKLGALDTATTEEITKAIALVESQNLEVEGAEGRQRLLDMKEELSKSIKTERAGDVEINKRAAANVWIAEMRFARRAEGIKQARTVFTKARKSPYLLWQVIEASATMELYWNKDPKIATNVFELGLKTFGNEVEYVMQYLDFLIKSNNDSNARALFERTVAKVEPAKAKALWDRWAQYEYQYGDFSNAQKLFLRYSEAFPEVSTIDRFAHRHAYLGLDDAITLDLGTIESTLPKSQMESRKRAPSPEPISEVERSNHVGRAEDVKRQKRDSASPAPTSKESWNRSIPVVPEEIGRRRPLELGGGSIGVERHALDARGEVTAVLPPGIVFFLSILPEVAAFNGPILNPATVVEVISTTLLPVSVGSGFSGERLGIPPRTKGSTPSNDYGARPPSPGREDYGGGGYSSNAYGGGSTYGARPARY